MCHLLSLPVADESSATEDMMLIMIEVIKYQKRHFYFHYC